MDIRSMENFLKIAELGNITRAAEALHVAQPPLSRQLMALEEELGVRLFIREKQRIYITEEGRFFKRQCEQILALVEKTKEQINEMRSGVSGTLFIGAIETVGNYMLPQWVADFKAQYPRVKYNLWSGNSDDVIARLEQGILDLALVREPFDREKYHSIPIKKEAWVVMLHEKHPLAQMSESAVPLRELRAEELIVPTRRSKEIREWFAEEGLAPNIMCEFAPLMNAVVLTEKGLGVAICPDSARYAAKNRAIVIKEISSPGRESSVALIWKKGVKLSGVCDKFISYIQGFIV